MASPFRIKICGVTNSTDALFAVQAGADAIGLNFFPGSKRFVSLASATEIAADVRSQFEPGRICITGVFVNATREEIVRTAQEIALNAVQLHGDETPEFVLNVNDALQAASFTQSPIVIRAFRCRAANFDAEGKYLLACDRPYAPQVPQAVLLDAYQPGTYGGTGAALDWDAVRLCRDRVGHRPIILAGGLTADNVSFAIAAAQPDAVDVASGVESSPGKKDEVRVRNFIENAKRAFDS
jgi:phosphoribosylanthranilate isomerase